MAVSLLLPSALASCSSSEESGAPTGASCDATLSYADDVAPILDRYCLACHSVEVPLTKRHGAPGDHNFDSEAEVIGFALHIEQRAGAGPDAQNQSMPPAGFRKPSDAERELLASFLACHLDASSGAPHHIH